MNYGDKNIKQNNQQYTMRDDIIQFSNQMVTKARNKYRKKNYFINNQISIQLNNKRQKYQQFSKQNQGMLLEQKDSKRDRYLDNSYNQKEQDKCRDQEKKKNLIQRIRIGHIDKKIGRYFDKNQSMGRQTFTSRQFNRNKNNNNFKIAKTQSMQIEKLNKIIPNQTSTTNLQSNSKQITPISKLFKSFSPSIRTNSYSQVQKKYNKGGFKDVGVQGWLNQALIQASPNMLINKNEENSGLKAYKIDRSSLLTKGIHPPDVNRLYRSFFVYSLGFNNLLKQLCNNNMDLRQLIWKVFAVLLEYCSGGNFETMIGEIQRDKQAKLNAMRSQIQIRQKIIQNNEEITQQKNSKILKQVRQLQQNTKQLQSQREIILQDFHQAEQAFNEQISLRLKYQSKINQIHGVYGQLQFKYQTLREQIQKNFRQFNKQKQNNKHLNKIILDNKIQIELQKQQISSLQSERLLLYQSLQSIENSTKITTVNYLSTKHTLQSFTSLLAEKTRRIDQLQLCLKSAQAGQKSLLATLKNNEKQYQRAIKQNVQFNEKINKNVLVINQLIEQKRQMGHQGNGIRALLAVQVRKVKQLQAKLRQSKIQIDELKENQRLKELQINTQLQRNKSLVLDIQNFSLSIGQMKQKQTQMSYNLDEANKKIETLQQMIGQKKQNQQKSYLKAQNIQTQMQCLRTEIKQKQSKITILQDNIKGQNQIWQIKYKKLGDEQNKIKQKLIKQGQKCIKLQQQNETLKQKYTKIYEDYKNQKFQRNNLDLYYKQALAVMQEEIDHIKKLNIQISEMADNIQQSKRKYNALQLIYKYKVESLQNELNLWKNKYIHMEEKVQNLQGYVHPMIHQDIQSNLSRFRNKYDQMVKYKLKIQRKLKQLQNQIFTLQTKQKQGQKDSTKELQQYYKKQITKREDQLNLIRERLIYQTQKVTQLEQILKRTSKQKNVAVQNVVKVEAEYMQKINQKNKQLKELNDKYRNSLHLNEQQLKQNQKIAAKYQNLQKQTHARNQQLTKKLKNQETYLKNKERIVTKHQNVQKIQSPQVKRNSMEQNQFSRIQKTNNKNGKSIMLGKQYNQESGWNNQQEQLQYIQNLGSKEPENNEQILDQKIQSVENFKQRQNIRKKIKGAFLYYRK